MQHYLDSTVKPWADEEEKDEMKLCQPRCVEILSNLLALHTNLSKALALDVAGGDGRLAVGLLLGLYEKVDLFDRCDRAIQIAKDSMENHQHCGNILKCDLQSFEWQK